MKPHKSYDVLIVGAGIAGCSLACALAQLDLKVALLDQSALKEHISDDIDLRTSAINLASQQLFQQLDVWSDITALRSSPYDKMTVWDNEGSIHFDCADIAEPHLGYIIENQVMLVALAKQLKQQANIDLLMPETPISLTTFVDSAQLLLESGQRLQAKLIVGADGGNSWVRNQVALNLKVNPYQQTAIVATVKTSDSHQQTAWQHFTPTGPLAFLPLADENTCSIVWSQNSEQASKLLSLEQQAFNQQLTEAFEYKLGKVELVSERKSFPLIMRHASDYIAPRIALVADAIHTIHPLAGLGLNLGLKDVACLHELIATCLQQKKDYGEFRQLHAYQRQRKRQNLTVLLTMRLFKQLFSNDYPSLSLLRNEGLKWTDKVQLLKNFIMRSGGYLSV